MQGIAYLAFKKSTAWLNQVINYHNMTSSRVSLLNAYNSLIAFPNFCTNNLHISYIVYVQIVNYATTYINSPKITQWNDQGTEYQHL